MDQQETTFANNMRMKMTRFFMIISFALIILGCGRLTQINTTAGYERSPDGTIKGTAGCGFVFSSENYSSYECFHNYERVITYALLDPVHGLSEKRQIAIQDSIFNVLEQILDIDFKRVNRFQNPIIRISGYSRDINANSDYFDGPGGVLAHAHWDCFYDCEKSNRINFDFDEKWTDKKGADGWYYQIVFLHELFHVLGNKHSSIHDSFMYPAYNEDGIFTDDDLKFLTDNYEINKNFSVNILPFSIHRTD